MISGMVVTKKSKTRNATQDDNDSKKVKKACIDDTKHRFYFVGDGGGCIEYIYQK